jgi:hypothetical protein
MTVSFLTIYCWCLEITNNNAFFLKIFLSPDIEIIRTLRIMLTNRKIADLSVLSLMAGDYSALSPLSVVFSDGRYHILA